jgi:hypothetical protein
MADEISESAEQKQHQMLSGETEYETAIDEVIAHAERTLRIFDSDLSAGGYSSIKRFEALRGFLAKSRNNRLVIVLHETDYLTSRCPRLMNLLKPYGHAISIQQTAEHARTANDPVMIADDEHYVHRFHRDGTRFLLALHDHLGARQLQERFDQLLEMSTPTVFATTTGL